MNNQKAVLIVEDENTLRILLQTVFEDVGVKVFATSDGYEAIEILKDHKDEIKVLIADLGLPKLGGWDTFMMMRKINPNLQGILASGYFEANIKEELIKAGATDFIQKPYNTKLLVSKVREILYNDYDKSRPS